MLYMYNNIQSRITFGYLDSYRFYTGIIVNPQEEENKPRVSSREQAQNAARRFHYLISRGDNGRPLLRRGSCRAFVRTRKVLVLTRGRREWCPGISVTLTRPHASRAGCSFPLHGIGGEATWRRVPQTKKDPSCSRESPSSVAGRI